MLSSLRSRTWRTTLDCEMPSSPDTRRIHLYSLKNGLGIHSWKPTWSCLIEALLATRVNFLQQSDHCILINCAFTFCMTLDQSRPGSNGNEGVAPHTSKLQKCCFVSYQGYLFLRGEDLILLQGIQSVYSKKEGCLIKISLENFCKLCLHILTQFELGKHKSPN